MSINKISPALKRYKPGEMSRNKNNSLNSNSPQKDISLQKIKEDTSQFFNSNKSIKINTGARINDIQRFGLESYKNPSINKDNIYLENNQVTPIKHFSIDEIGLDFCFENLKKAFKTINDNKILTRQLKENILPETIFRKDSIILYIASLNEDNLNNYGKDRLNVINSKCEEEIVNVDEEINMYKKEIHSGKILSNNSENSNGLVSNSNHIPSQESYINISDSIQEDSSFRHNKFQSSNDSDNVKDMKKIQIQIQNINQTDKKNSIESSFEEIKQKELEFTCKIYYI